MAIEAARLQVTVGADTGPAEKNIQGFRSRLNQSAADMGRTGAVLSAAVSAPIIGIGVDALNTAANFQQAMANVGAISRASESDLARLTATAQDLGRTTSFSATEASEGMTFLAQAGFSVEDTLSAMPGLLALAAAGATDLGTSADLTSNILSGMNIEASETGRVADVLAATFTRSNTNLEQLGSAMSYVAPQAANLGISLEETAAAVGLLSDAGIQGTRAGTGLNAVLARLGAPTTAAADAMADLGVSVFDAQGNMQGLPAILGQFERALDGMTGQQRAEALSDIFDSRALASFSVLLAAGSDELEQFASTMDEVSAMDVAAMQLDTFEGQIKLLNSALEGLKITVANAVLPALQDIASRAGPVITRVTEWFESLDRSTQMAGFAFLGLAAAAGPVMLTLAGVAAGLAFLLSPIGLVVAGTAALGAAWVGDFAGMRTATLGLVDAVRGFVDPLVATFNRAREAGLEPLRAAVYTVQTAFEDWDLRWASDMLGDFETAAGAAWRALSDAGSTVLTFGSYLREAATSGDVLNEFLAGIPAPLRGFAQALGRGAAQLGALAGHISSTIRDSDSLGAALGTLARQGVDFLSARVAALVTNVQTRLEPLEAAFTRVSDIMAGIASGDLEPAREALRDAFSAISDFNLNAFISTLSSAGVDTAAAILSSFSQVDLPALRDDIISKLGLDNFQLFPEGGEASFDWSSVQVNTAALVAEVQSQFEGIDFSAAAAAVRTRVQVAFTGIQWETLSPVDVTPLVQGIQRGFAGAQAQLSAAFAGDNPLSRFFERVRGVADYITEQMAGFGSAPLADRFERVVSSVLATIGLIGDTRLDLVQTATRHLSSLTTAVLNFGTDIVDGLDAENIAAVLGSVATEWSNAFGAVFEDASLFDVASAAGSLGSSFVNKLGEILGAPEFGEDVGKAVGNMTVALTQGAQELVTGIVDGVSDTDWNQFSANFSTFTTGFINGVSSSLEEANYGAIAGAIVTGISTWLAEQWRQGMDAPTADFESGTSLAAVTGSAGFEAGEQVRESILSAATDAAVFALAQMNDFLWPDIPEPSDDFWPVIDSPASDFWPEPQAPDSSWWPTIPELTSEWWADIPELASTWWAEIPELASSWWAVIPELDSEWWPSIDELTSEWWPDITELTSSWWPEITELTSSWWPEITELTSSWWPNITRLESTWWPSILRMESTWWPDISRLASTWWPTIPAPSWLGDVGGGGGGGGDRGFDAIGRPHSAGGWTFVGERGPELVRLPAGSTVKSHRESMDMAGGDVHLHIHGDVIINNEQDEEAFAERIMRKIQQRR